MSNSLPAATSRRSYSDEEIAQIYELARLCLENGDLKRAEALFVGLSVIAPKLAVAWLGVSYVRVYAKDWEGATHAARKAVSIEPPSVEALLFLSAMLLNVDDLSAAGTYLGEVQDLIEAGAVQHPHLIRFYKVQLARYQSRGLRERS